MTVGSNLTYTVSLRNRGGDATNVVITDTLPEGVLFVSASVTNASSQPFTPPVLNAGTVRATLANFLAGDVATLVIIVQPDHIGTLTNEVQPPQTLRM